MKKVLSVLIFITMIFIPLYSDSWSGGYRIDVNGYSDAVHDSMDHLGFSLIHMPWLSDRGAVELYGKIELSNPLIQPVSAYVHGGVALSVLVMHDTPFDSLLIRDSSWRMKTDFSVGSPLSSLSSVVVQAKFSPFSLFFGDKVIAVASPVITYETEGNSFGWGISLFELTHYLW